MNNVVKQEGSIYYFDSQTTAAKDLQTGDVIVSGSGTGMIRKVKSVSTSDDGSIVVETEPAALEDAIKEGTISYTGKLTHGDLASTKTLMKGVELRKAEKLSSEFNIKIDTVIYDEDKNEDTTSDQVKLSGEVTLTFEPDIAMDFRLLKGLKEFKFAITTNTTQDLSIVIGGGIDLIDKKIPLKTFYFNPIPIGAFVILIPEVTIYAGIEGEAEVSVTSKVGIEASYTAGAHYKDGNWEPISNLTKKFTHQSPTISGEVSVKGYIGPEFYCSINGVAGPSVGAEGYLKLNGGASVYPSTSLWWKLYGGIAAYVKAEIKIIKWTIAEYRADLIKYETELAGMTIESASNHNPSISSVTANPSSANINGTSTLTCNASDPDNDPLTYSWTKTGGSISGSGSSVTWTAPSTAGTYTVNCDAFDSKGSTAQQSTTITVTIPPQSDLIIKNLKINPSSGLSGSSVTVDFTIYNQGSGTANASTTNIRMSASALSVASTDSLLTSISIPEIAGGGSYYVTKNLTIPSNQPVGKNYIWAITDVDNTANQSDTTNDKTNISISITSSTFVDTTAPSNPSVSINSGASSTTSTSVTLTLSATDTVGVTGYCAKESSTTPSSNDSCWTSVTSTTSYSATVSFTLSSGSVGDNTKTVYVWFRDSAGNVSASASDSITLTVYDTTAPSAPTGVSASAGNGQVTISWSSVSGATSYNIYWSTTSGVTKTTGTKLTGTTSPYTHTGLTNGTTYYYVVTAENSAGQSTESSEVSETPSLTPPPPP